METVISTMPIKPQQKTSIGMIIAPTIMDYIGDSLNGTKILATNTLNTYKQKDNELPIYVSDVDKNRIHYNEIFNDKKEANNIMMIIQKMVDDNVIQLTNERIMRCECGKVDILESAIRNFSDGKLYKQDDNGSYICKSCGCACKTYNESVLTVSFEKYNYNELKIVPTFLKKEVTQFEKSFESSKILISKARNTGYTVTKNGKSYFIDIDFIWMNYPNLLSGDKKILIASNHQLLKMFIMNYINNISSKQDITFVAHPYMKTNDINYIESIYDQSQDEYFKKLFILYQMNWSKKTCNYSESVIKYLSNISNTRRLNLYRNIIELSQEYNNQNSHFNTDELINKMIINSINMQKNINDAKKYVKK